MRVEIYVKPGASTTNVGGTHDGELVVRVVEPAESGRATDAVLRAVAKAVQVPRRSVKLVLGATSRRKLVEIEVGPEVAERVQAAVERLRNQSH